MICLSKTTLMTVAALAGVLCACATPTEIVKLHHDRSQPGAPYEKLLVVGIATTADERRRLEDLLSSELKAQGTAAVAGWSLTGASQSVLQADIDNAAIEAAADAILVTHIVSVDQQVELQEGRTEVLLECRGGDPADYFLYDSVELKLPDDVSVAHTVAAVSNLYLAGSGERIWTIQSTCFEKSGMDEVLQEEAVAIARQLRRDGLIK